MRQASRGFIAVVAFLGAYRPTYADTPPRGEVRGIVVDEVAHQPIAGATAILTPATPSPHVVAATSDAAGRFAFRELPAGSYSVLVLFGDARKLIDNVGVGVDQTVDIRAALPTSSEIITIQEDVPVSQPKAITSTVRQMLPYTDEAIDSNDWAVGWLLLDISALGEVTSFRFLHRPDRGLDAIAQREVWRLRFEPARDAAGRGVPSQILWKMEWPSYWWYRERVFKPDAATIHPDVLQRDVVTGRIQLPRGPGVTFLTPTNKANLQLPPCRDTAPLNLDMGGAESPRTMGLRMASHGSPAPVGVANVGSASDNGVGIGARAVYRDCSPPDKNTTRDEPLIRRPR